MVANQTPAKTLMLQYTAHFDLIGVSPFSQSRPLAEKKAKDESDEAFEQRVWRDRLHVNAAGQVIVPCMMLKATLAATAQYRSERIAGKGQQTYTKHVLAGLLCLFDLPIIGPSGQPLMKDDVEGERLFLNADGKRGGGVRVWRIYPCIPEGWRASAKAYMTDGLVSPAKLEEYAKDAGLMIGFGRFRPRNGGFYGRFRVENFRFVEGLEP